MIDPATVGLVSALTALVASIVGPLTTLHIGRSQIRAAVLATNRQKWIDGFRDLVAAYCGQVAAIAQIQQNIIRDDRVSVAHDPELLRQFEMLIVTFIKIKLMMNPNEKDHHALLAVMQTVLDEFRRPQAPSEIGLRVEMHVKEIANATQTILRREWERVKHLA